MDVQGWQGARNFLEIKKTSCFGDIQEYVNGRLTNHASSYEIPKF